MLLWNQLCEGRTVLLDQLPEISTPVFNNTIYARIIRAIFESNQFDAPGYEYITIKGGTIHGPLKLSGRHLRNTVSIIGTTFTDAVDLSYASTEHNFDLSGSIFLSSLNFKGFSSTKSIFLSNASTIIDYSTNIPRRAGDVSFNLSRVDGGIYIWGVDAASISAVGAQVGQLFFHNSKVVNLDLEALQSSSLEVDGVIVGEPPPSLEEKHAVADGKTPRKRVCKDFTNIDSIRITGAVHLDRSSFGCGVSMTAAHVGGEVSLRGAYMGKFDFSGSRADGDLEIGPLKAGEQWYKFDWDQDLGMIILSHSSVNSVRVAFNMWPGAKRSKELGTGPIFFGHCADMPSTGRSSEDGKKLTWKDFVLGLWDEVENKDRKIILGDFSFKTIAPPYYCLSTDIVADGLRLPFSYVAQWLVSAKFSPQEFEYVQGLFRINGQEAEGRQLGFLQKEIENARDYNEGSYFSGVALTLSRLTIGYGYYTQVSIIWALGFWAMGWAVFRSLDLEIDIRGKDNTNYADVSGFWYSIDMLLPVIKLREKHYEFEIRKVAQRRYFYLHRIMGYFLGFFVFSGLTGLAH